jgi:hypothetical protein
MVGKQVQVRGELTATLDDSDSGEAASKAGDQLEVDDRELMSRVPQGRRRMVMKTFSSTLSAVVGFCVIAMAGCAVDQTQEARPPDVDVAVEPGRWPAYDAGWADIDIGTSERTITVPVLRIEKETRQISVPYIDINPPGARDRDERVLSIDVDVPHSGYEVQIVEVRASDDDLWVIGQLRETAPPSTRMRTRISDHVMINAPLDLDVRTVVVGEQPDGNEHLRFVESRDALQPMIPDGARVLYRRSALPGFKGA